MKDYCVQNNGECSTCSLVNYRRDCMNNPIEPDNEIAEMIVSGRDVLGEVTANLFPCEVQE